MAARWCAWIYIELQIICYKYKELDSCGGFYDLWMKVKKNYERSLNITDS
jgi:hypothetical protein